MIHLYKWNSKSGEVGNFKRVGFCSVFLTIQVLGSASLFKKLKIDQCMPFVDKIIEKIICWKAKLLTYARTL